VPTLHVLQGPDKGRTYQTGDEPALIGRWSDQIQLTDNSTSRRHAEIRPVGGAWVLVDLGSSNATYLNGQRVVSAVKLKDGDQIKVGSSLLVFSANERIGSLTGPSLIADLVDLGGSGSGESSILSSISASEDSVILQPPETADAVAAWNAVYKIAEMIGTIDSVGAFLGRMADVVFEHLIVDRLVIMTYPDDGQELVPQVVRFRYEQRDRKPKIVTSRKIVAHVVDTKSGLLCANAMTDDRFSPESSQDSIHRLGLRSVICVPIIAHEAVQGVIHLDCSMSHHTYTHEQLRLAIAIGRLTGMAIENARLLEQRMRTERLAAAGETVAYLSHHIRNLVQGLHGAASTVETGIAKRSVDTIASGWGMMKRNLERTGNLVMNMLTFSKERKPSMQPGNISRTIEDVLALAQPLADERGIMLLADLEETPLFAYDPDGIHQVLHNIVLNAIQAVAPDAGRVNIRANVPVGGAFVDIAVSDNGPGMAADVASKVFDAFYSSRGHAGTGLGLAASKKIVLEHHGQISVDSTPGAGTTFLIRLPVDRSSADSPERTQVIHRSRSRRR
jgi:signal transduction histidine kinase